MHSAFEKLDKEKQLKIINAALIEFGQKGFEQASTNQIVKDAGIGKGMLFYYFNNKLDLYHYLIEYSLNIIRSEYLEKVDETIEDIIDRLKENARVKMEYFRMYPEVNQFLGRFILQSDEQLPLPYQNRIKELFELGSKKMYGNKEFHQSPFRENIDHEKAYQIIEWSIRGYQQDLLQKMSGTELKEEDIKPLWDEFDDYLNILKTCFYKQ